MSLLTVIVPLYNNEKYIRQCLDSICNQSYRDISIIVVDDGSTDEGGFIADEVAKNDNRIIVIHQENKGLAEARFCGLNKCQTEYSTFVDSDDFILNNSYEYAVESMESGIDMIFFEISRYFSDKHIRRERHTLSPGLYDKNRIEDEIYDKLIWDFNKDCRGLEPSQCVRITKTKLLIERYESFKERVFYGEDILVTYPIHMKIQSLEVAPYSFYMHRQYTEERPYICSDSFFREVYCLYNQLYTAFLPYYDNSYLFKRQIEYLYMYLVQEKRNHISTNPLKDRYLFPFDKTAPGKRMILYGAGNVGRVFYHQLDKIRYSSAVLWVDKDAEYLNDDRIKGINEISGFDADYVVVAIDDRRICIEVANYLKGLGIDDEKIIYGC